MEETWNLIEMDITIAIDKALVAHIAEEGMFAKSVQIKEWLLKQIKERINV